MGKHAQLLCYNMHNNNNNNNGAASKRLRIISPISLIFSSPISPKNTHRAPPTSAPSQRPSKHSALWIQISNQSRLMIAQHLKQ